MGKKFCPQCNMNVRVSYRGLKGRCSCCGYNADYMCPPVSEKYSATRPPSQNTALVKPDIHEEEDRTFGEHITVRTNMGTDVSADAVADVVLRIIVMVFLLISFVFSLIATYDSYYSWNMSDGRVVTDTLYNYYASQGIGEVIIGMTLITVLVIVFAPKLVAIPYFMMGLLSALPADSMNFETPFGIIAFMMALVIGCLVTVWGRVHTRGDSPLFVEFWFKWNLNVLK